MIYEKNKKSNLIHNQKKMFVLSQSALVLGLSQSALVLGTLNPQPNNSIRQSPMHQDQIQSGNFNAKRGPYVSQPTSSLSLPHSSC